LIKFPHIVYYAGGCYINIKKLTDNLRDFN
jgi:hypothetical protein